MTSAWQAFYIGTFVALGLEAGRALWSQFIRLYYRLWQIKRDREMRKYI